MTKRMDSSIESGAGVPERGASRRRSCSGWDSYTLLHSYDCAFFVLNLQSLGVSIFEYIDGT
jgi:hypothetical protein